MVSLWKTVLNGLNGFVEGHREDIAEIERAMRLHGLCASLGCQMHKEENGTLSLYFRDAMGRRHLVSIAEWTNSIVVLAVCSKSLLPGAQVPHSVIDHLMVGNHEGFASGAWAAWVPEGREKLVYLRKFVVCDA